MNEKSMTLALLAVALMGVPAAAAAIPQDAPGTPHEVAVGPTGELAGSRTVVPTRVASPDTVIPVDRGTRLMVKNHQGSITVRIWDRPAVRLAPSPAESRFVQISGDGKLLRILSGPGRGGSTSVDLVLTVPAEMSLDLAGPHTDVTVETTRGQVTIETINGDASVRGGTSVSIRSVNGDVTVREAGGGVQIHSVSGDVNVTGAEGDLSVEAISGDVTLRGIRSSNVRVSTVSGDVVHDGELRDGGRYRLATHSGSVVAAVPTGADVTVAVRTYSGDFQASFPITLQTGEHRRFEFALGDGAARLELEAFSGDVRLVRPGELPAPRP